MQYIELPGLNNPLSRFIFGTSIKPMSEGTGADNILDGILAEGVNAFDTARVYGESERILGQWIRSRGIRDRVNIITKGCHHDARGSRVTPEALTADVEMSLKCLGTDYIDIYLLHRDDMSRPVEDMIDALNRLQRQGKILRFGASNWTHWRIAEANDYAMAEGLDGFCVSSPCFSAAKRVFDPWGGSIDISDDREALDWYASNDLPVLAYSALARGYLAGGAPAPEYRCPENAEALKRLKREAAETGITLAQAAIIWLLKQEMTVCPIISPTQPGHIRSAAAAFDI